MIGSKTVLQNYEGHIKLLVATLISMHDRKMCTLLDKKTTNDFRFTLFMDFKNWTR